MSRVNTRLTPTIDLDAAGKRNGFVRLPWSSHESAYGGPMIPICVVRGGRGPTVLAVAGNHGDEYEGQIALMRLIREIEPEEVAGRLIVLPAANFPAVLAGSRVSPMDGGNLNRSFPGDPEGGPTSMIAHFVETELIARADAVIDLHSGGTSLHYLPSTIVARSADPGRDAANRAALEAFGTPYGFLVDLKESRVLIGAAERQGVVALNAELGGGAHVTPASVARTEGYLRNLLIHFGLVDRRPEDALSGAVRLMTISGPRYYVYAPEDGIFEPAVDLGDTVGEGDLAGLVHDP
ncbi:MAG: succinylglutamate desuccinylase/aspartoacylase family protein [Azospirillaceae bacterium]